MIATLYDFFKHWSDGGSVYIISDTHFDDKDCKLMNPDWITPLEHVKRINDLVLPSDTLVVLGDLGDASYFNLIKSKYKVAILGNHDNNPSKYRPYFNEVYTGALFIAEKILLSHEPISLPFCLNIHGHDHNNVENYKEGCKHLNVCSNVCDYTPINLGKIIKQGILADIPSIHRMTIDRAVERKQKENE